MAILTLWFHLPMATPTDVLAVEDTAGVIERLGYVTKGDFSTDCCLHHICHTAGRILYLEYSNRK